MAIALLSSCGSESVSIDVTDTLSTMDTTSEMETSPKDIATSEDSALPDTPSDVATSDTLQDTSSTDVSNDASLILLETCAQVQDCRYRCDNDVCLNVCMIRATPDAKTARDDYVACMGIACSQTCVDEDFDACLACITYHQSMMGTCWTKARVCEPHGTGNCSNHYDCMMASDAKWQDCNLATSLEAQAVYRPLATCLDNACVTACDCNTPCNGTNPAACGSCKTACVDCLQDPAKCATLRARCTCEGACATGSKDWCMDGQTACRCDTSDDLAWEVTDCSAMCTEQGHSSFGCHRLAEKDYGSCECAFTDCASTSTAVIQDCTNRIYTNCTCAAADPCGWAEDETCDALCIMAFPEDHFTDKAGACNACQEAELTTCGEGSPCCATDSLCSCDVTDPCGRRRDGTCDQSCTDRYPDTTFDDFADCLD